MADRRIVENIIKDTARIVDYTNFTYISRIFPQLGNDSSVILVCKDIISPVKLEPRVVSNLKDEELCATDHDVTGSPLQHSFGDDNFDVSIVGEFRNWTKDEENHVPMGKMQASTILNLCLEEESASWKAPLFALCDGSDIEKIVLLGAFVEEGWFHTMNVRIGDLAKYSKIQDCALVMQEHCRLSKVSEHEVKVSISSLYEFSGSSQKLMDWSETRKCDFSGYLSLEMSWSTLSFLPPARATTNYLIAEVAAGWRASPLNGLWDQLLLLDKYLSILESYQKRNVGSRYSILPLKFPQGFDAPFHKRSDSVMDRLTLLLSGDDAFDNSDPETNLANGGRVEYDADLDENATVSSCLKELPSRQNLDFSDQFWQLVISSNEYVQMTDCIHAVLVDIAENNYKPQMYETVPTRLAKLMSGLRTSNGMIPSLAGSFPLELVIDMGMEKMCRDYTYLLVMSNLADVYDMRKMWTTVSTGEFNVEKYRTKLMTMAQIHICLEFLLIVQKNLDCSNEISRSFFNYALKLYTSSESPVKSFADLVNNTIYTLRAPGLNAVIKEVSKSSPTSWRGTLSSSQRASKFTTTTHYSNVPIFPQNIYSPDDEDIKEECYHTTTAVTCAYKTN